MEKIFTKIAAQIEGKKSDDYLEIAIFKKHKINTDEFFTKPVKYFGYKPSDFRKISVYNPDPFKIPYCGVDFEEAKKA